MLFVQMTVVILDILVSSAVIFQRMRSTYFNNIPPPNKQTNPNQKPQQNPSPKDKMYCKCSEGRIDIK